jgi:conjugative relaxase-like TrwC/TraI family protein
MVIVHRLGRGAARYYLAAVAPGGGEAPLVGEAPGRWAGRGAPDGPVDARALAGRMPEGPGRLPGLDVTFSAPKSVSVLHALGDAATVAAVRGAHDDAVSAGLAYLERHACRVRVGGRAVGADAFVAAAFRHRTSRADDPHLHTHVVVANCADGPDGRARALHTPALYAERRGAAATYHLVLRAGLTTSLGLRWAVPTMGHADALDVPDDVRAAFSRRRAALLGASGSLADRRWAEHATRPPRDGLVDYESLVFGWRRRAASVGWSAPQKLAPRPLIVRDAGEGLLPSADGWSRGDLMVALANHWRDGAPGPSVEATADRLLHSPEVIERSWRFVTRVADARARAVASALGGRARVPAGPEALDAMHLRLARDGRCLVVVVPDRATAELVNGRAGVAAVPVADGGRAVAALGPGDVVVISTARRLPSSDVERVLATAARRGVEVVRGDPCIAMPQHRPIGTGITPCTVAVAGGDVTAAATPWEAAETALGDWLARRRTGAGAVIVAERHEVDAMNARARAALRGAGLLGSVEVGGFAVGDAVWFSRARPAAAVARCAQGEVAGVTPGAIEVRLWPDARLVRLPVAELRSVAHAHVVPPLPALVAGRGDVFVVGGRTFAPRHLDGAQLHRYITDASPERGRRPAQPSHLGSESGVAHRSRLAFGSTRDRPPPAPPWAADGLSPLTRTPEQPLALARHAAGRGSGRSR